MGTLPVNHSSLVIPGCVTNSFPVTQEYKFPR